MSKPRIMIGLTAAITAGAIGFTQMATEASAAMARPATAATVAAKCTREANARGLTGKLRKKTIARCKEAGRN